MYNIVINVDKNYSRKDIVRECVCVCVCVNFS